MADGQRTSERTSARTERSQDPAQAEHEPHEDHGHSVAAWSLVGIVILGSIVSGFAMVLSMPWLFFVGLGIAVVGLVVGKVLKAMGFGATVYEQDSGDPHQIQGVK